MTRVYAQFSVPQFDKETTSTKPAPNLQTHINPINPTGRIWTGCISEVGLRTASRLFGCSDEFWNNVIKPFHGAMACTPYTLLDGLMAAWMAEGTTSLGSD